VFDDIVTPVGTAVADVRTKDALMTNATTPRAHPVTAWGRSLIGGSIRLVPWQLRSVVKRIPVVAWLQRRLLKLGGHEFIHTIDAGPAAGLKFPVVLPDDKGVWTGTYELDFIQSLADAVRPGDVCFDVGGWRGFCAGVMACRGASRVTVFEPLPANILRIRRMMELNRERTQFDLQECAAGAQDGKAEFHLMPESSMGKLGESHFQADQQGAERISVQVRSLDSYCDAAGLDRVDVIKLDVEGAELMALQGADRLLRTFRPRLFIEAHSRALTRDVTAYLTERSYAVITLETGRAPDGRTEPDVCHLRATPQADGGAPA
jgi:FkbM family methyltransferase